MTPNELTLVVILLGVTLFLAALVVLQTVRLDKARAALERAMYEAEMRAICYDESATEAKVKLAAVLTETGLDEMLLDAFQSYFEYSHIARWRDMEIIHAWLEARQARQRKDKVQP